MGTNQLSESNSPYLLQHADNPVNWYPWGEDALKKAKQEDKPIFLSIGYAACHWCHVMAHESFEDEEIAQIMNEHFVNIKVDREERPDLDDIYMQAVVALTGQGGWPMSVFLTPEGEPFYGGTYFPPARRYNIPGFREVLHAINDAWQNSRESLLNNARQVTNHITSSIPSLDTDVELSLDDLFSLVAKLDQQYDWEHGGWGRAPKFPQAMTIEFLLQLNLLGDQDAGEMAFHALDQMAKGGMYDLIGGGFARYSVDNEWLVPHFEKMLYDNAQLALVYLHAYIMTKNERYYQIVTDTLDFVEREMMHPDGGFYSSLDADSEGVEGKYYAWTFDELLEIFDDPYDFKLFSRFYGVTTKGNFDHDMVLQRKMTIADLAEETELQQGELEVKFEDFHQQLFEIRQTRVRPGTDDKVITFWNGLMLVAFAEAGRYLKNEHYTQTALQNARFLVDNLYNEGNLYRSWRNGSIQHLAFLEDYAALILGLLSLYQTDPNLEWFATAQKLSGKMIELFIDDDWGFYDTGKTHEKLISRPKSTQDNATPSGNSLAVMALLQMYAYTGNSEYLNTAEKSIHAILELSKKHPTAFAQWLTDTLMFLVQPKEIAIIHSQKNNADLLIDALWSEYRPHIVAAISTLPIPENAPTLLQNRDVLDQKPTAFVCKNFTCKLPTTQVEEFLTKLNS